jgi:competence protein ComEC
MQFFSWKSVPFIRFLPALIAGILLAIYSAVPEYLSVLLIAFGAVGIHVMRQTRFMRLQVLLDRWVILPLYGLLIGLGMLLVDIHSTQDDATHFSKYQRISYLQVQVTAVPQQKKKSHKLVLDVSSVLRESTWIPAKGRLLAYVEQDVASGQLEIGDCLLIPVAFKAIDEPSNPGEFDYKKFLMYRDIYHQQYLPSSSWHKEGYEASLRRTAEQWRQVLLARLEQIDMQADELSVAAALVLGKKDSLDPALRQSYASAGAMHVLAVSGLHVGIIYFILSSLLKWVERFHRGKLIKALLLITALWVYALVTGLSPSVVRAATMFSAVTLAGGIGRKSNIYNTVGASAFVLLLFDPFYIMEVGFQLSYLAVLGIIYLHSKLYNLLYTENWLLDKVWEISCVSIAAQLVTFPLGLLYFHQFPTYFLISNLVVIPAAFLILYLGLGYLVFGWIPFLGDLIGLLLKYSIRGLNKGVLWVESLPYSLLQGIDISVVESYLIYGVLASLCIFWIYKQPRALWPALGLLLVLSAQSLYERMSFERYPHMVVYDVRGHAVINLLSDQDNFLICDSIMAHDKDRQQFHFRNHWNQHAAPEPIHVLQDSACNLPLIAPSIYSYQGKVIAHVHSKEDIPIALNPLDVDYLVISNFKGLRLDVIMEHFNPKQVILDSSIRDYLLERLCEQAPGVPIHAVGEDGYFSARL